MVKLRVPAWRFEDLSKNAYVTFWVEWWDGANYNVAKVRYDVVNTKWQYLNSSNAWTDVITTHILNVSVWHSLELDIDFTHSAYLRLMVDDRTITFSSTNLYVTADTTKAKAQLTFETVTQGASAAEAYFDGTLGDPITVTEIGE